MKNPIIDNRIISDKTFATRLVLFLNDIKINDQWGEEELKYLKRVGKELLNYQMNTATDDSEINYLNRMNGINSRS